MVMNLLSKVALWVLTVVLGIIALRPLSSPDLKVSAESSRFDHINIVSPLFLFKGAQGLLVLDRRNGNVWFIGKHADEMDLRYREPVFVTQIPFEKLDQPPR